MSKFSYKYEGEWKWEDIQLAAEENIKKIENISGEEEITILKSYSYQIRSISVSITSITRYSSFFHIILTHIIYLSLAIFEKIIKWIITFESIHKFEHFWKKSKAIFFKVFLLGILNLSHKYLFSVSTCTSSRVPPSTHSQVEHFSAGIFPSFLLSMKNLWFIFSCSNVVVL